MMREQFLGYKIGMEERVSGTEFSTKLHPRIGMRGFNCRCKASIDYRYFPDEGNTGGLGLSM